MADVECPAANISNREAKRWLAVWPKHFKQYLHNPICQAHQLSRVSRTTLSRKGVNVTVVMVKGKLSHGAWYTGPWDNIT